MDSIGKVPSYGIGAEYQFHKELCQHSAFSILVCPIQTALQITLLDLRILLLWCCVYGQKRWRHFLLSHLDDESPLCPAMRTSLSVPWGFRRVSTATLWIETESKLKPWENTKNCTRIVITRVSLVNLCSSHWHLNTPPQNSCRERVDLSTKLRMSSFNLLCFIVEQKEFHDCWNFLIPKILNDARVRLKICWFFPKNCVTHHSSCLVEYSARHVFCQNICTALQCTLPAQRDEADLYKLMNPQRPYLQVFLLCTLVQDAQWWPWRCCCLSKIQFWVVSQSDTLTDVSHTTLQCNLLSSPVPLMKLRKAIQLPESQTSVEQWSTDRLPTHLHSWSTLSSGLQPNLHPLSHGWRRLPSQPKGSSIHTSDGLWDIVWFPLQLCLWGCFWSCCISHNFFRTKSNVKNVVLSRTDRFQHLIGSLDVPTGPTCRLWLPDCNSTADVPSFIQRTALPAIPFVSDRWCVNVQWFQDKSSLAFPSSKELSAKMTFGFSDGSRNFRKLLSVSWEVLVLHKKMNPLSS